MPTDERDGKGGSVIGSSGCVEVGRATSPCDDAAVYLLEDYRGAFWSSTRNRWTLCSMDKPRLCAALERRGRRPVLMSFSEASRSIGPEWAGRAVVYQTAEDEDLRYRSYVEDVILALESAGARLLPPFRFLRAHHNKVFADLLLRSLATGGRWLLPARCFGTAEEAALVRMTLPAVVKSASGAGSRGVHLARTERELEKAIRTVSRYRGCLGTAKELHRRIVRRGYVHQSLYREKFVVQEFVPGLDSDFKVLVYGGRVFVLRRGVRDDDFRASGSGRFSWPERPPEIVLDLAEQIRDVTDVPFLSLDIGSGPSGPVLFEVQFVGFGPLTVEQSPWHFRRCGGAWSRIDGPSSLEDVFAEAVDGALSVGDSSRRAAGGSDAWSI